jgi:outer membrane lipoprotein SlyB
MQIVKFILVIATVTLMLSGCSTGKSTKIYTEDQALQYQDVEKGTVESVEPAIIRKDGTIVGTVGGAVLGGLAGSTVGGGRGSDIATAAGVIIGGALGSLFEQGITDRGALKIIVVLDDGGTMAIVQEDDVSFQPGERVNILTSHTDYTKRVSKLR